MVRNGGQSVQALLGGTQQDLQQWITENLDGCRASHIARAVSESLPVTFDHFRSLPDDLRLVLIDYFRNVTPTNCSISSQDELAPS